MIITCPGCRTTCRIPATLTTRLRCAKCKREFTPRDLTNARPEPTRAPTPAGQPDEPGWDDFDLTIDDDIIDLD